VNSVWERVVSKADGSARIQSVLVDSFTGLDGVGCIILPVKSINVTLDDVIAKAAYGR